MAFSQVRQAGSPFKLSAFRRQARDGDVSPSIGCVPAKDVENMIEVQAEWPEDDLRGLTAFERVLPYAA
jgi:hypothetical protein